MVTITGYGGVGQIGGNQFLLEWPDGYARVGETLQIDGNEALREYAPLEGALAAGDRVRFDNSAYPGDPARAHGISFEEIRFASPLGELAAWQVDGSDVTRVIFVRMLRVPDRVPGSWTGAP